MILLHNMLLLYFYSVTVTVRTLSDKEGPLVQNLFDSQISSVPICEEEKTWTLILSLEEKGE